MTSSIVFSVWLLFITTTSVFSQQFPGTSYLLNSVLYDPKDCTKYCVRKCCRTGYHVGENQTCVQDLTPGDDSRLFQVTIYDGIKPISKIPNVDAADGISNYAIVSGLMDCVGAKRYRLDPGNFREDEFLLQNDGNLWEPNAPRTTYILRDSFCLDYFEDMGRVSALVCLGEERTISHRINSLGMIISMPFLLVTFLVQALLPDKTVHACSLMCYVLALFWAYFLLVYLHLNANDLEDVSCIAASTSCIFFFLASFFWMNVISVDMWRTFSGINSLRTINRISGGERNRFLLYSAYAWSLPLIMVILLMFISYNSSLDRWFNPGLGRQEQCWFQNKLVELLYLYGPVAVLIIINVVLFTRTYYNIKKVRVASTNLRKHSRRDKYEKDVQNFGLYLKLMLAMGVNWATEVISWLVMWLVVDAPLWIWYPSDFCNALYGLFIFFVFVFKPSVWRDLKIRYYSLIGKPYLASTLRTSSGTDRSTGRSASTNETHV